MSLTGSKRKFQIAFSILFFAGLVYARSAGPDRGYTGAPGDNGSCVDCHDTFHQANIGQGRLQVSGQPTVYEPGQSYILSITVQDPSRKRWGFQLTAIDSFGFRAGTLAPVGPETQIAQTGVGAFDRQYVEHSSSGTFPGTTGGHTWQIRWTAPSNDAGNIQFFAAGNAANNDGTNQGDYIYTTRVTSESPGSAVSISLVSVLDGLTLVPGSQITLSWTATNHANIDSIELRYSTDDGMTFPITNLIFSTSDPEVSSTLWMLPAVTTTQARVRVQAATKQGAAVEVRSGRFSISDVPPNPNTPKIISMSITGKNLFVTGEKFQKGAIVEMSGTDILTQNQKDFSRQLKCPKAAKNLPPGVAVPFVVRNPDGLRSDQFLFTR